MIDPIGDAVARELGRFGSATGMTRIVEAWPSAVGPEIARNAWPARLARDGSLRVHTTDSVWAFELGTRAAEIRERLGELAPARLVFAAGPLPEPPVEWPEASRGAGVAATPEHYEEATPLVRGIRDENLRKIVAKTIATGLAAARSGRSFW